MNLKDFPMLIICGGLINAEKNTAKFCMNTQSNWKNEFENVAESVTFAIEAEIGIKNCKDFF